MYLARERFCAWHSWAVRPRMYSEYDLQFENILVAYRYVGRYLATKDTELVN